MGGGRALLLVPGGLDRITGGNLYDAAAVGGMRERGWTVEIRDPPQVTGSWDCVIVDSLAFPFGRPQIPIPYVALVHQLPSGAAGFPEPTVAERDVLRFASLVVTVSHWLGDLVARYTRAPVNVVTPGWDRAWARNGPEADAASVLCVANAVPGKGVPEAVETFGRTSRSRIAKLELIGDLDVDPEESARVREALEKFSGSIETLGVVQPEVLAERYAKARAFLTASAYEGWPTAVAEAMASGVPVAGYDIPGLRELVRGGRDGLLARPGDVDDLAVALGDILEDRVLSLAMSRAARRRAMAWPTWADTATGFADAVEALRA